MNKEKVTVLKALADDTRFAIVAALITTKEMSCQDVTDKFNLSQPTMSHHLNKLVLAGIVNARKDKVWSRYSLNKDYLKKMGINLHTFFENENNADQ
jgi:ArsR family transcriptional regulator